MKNQTVLVLDFGGQYKELVAKSVRACGVYSLVKPGRISASEVKAIDPIGIILTGPIGVFGDASQKCDPAIFELGVPVLGISYGMELLCGLLGGKLAGKASTEIGKVDIVCDKSSALFDSISENQPVFMSSGGAIDSLPNGFKATAKTAAGAVAAIENPAQKLFAVKFHPEAEGTKNGVKIIRSFLFNVCGTAGDYGISQYISDQIAEIKATVGSERVLLALSGGVDSSVCAALLSKAIPGQLTCIFVDHGFMRKNEGNEIEAAFADKNLNFIRVNAQERFLNKLAGVSDPERKRKIIGAEFIAVFEDEAKKLGRIPYLAQGTIYPDIIESGADNSANVKSHHNVGGLPAVMDFKGIVEPLKGLFKDEVRKMGRKLGLPKELTERQPFPGPGLAIRVIGELTVEKLDILRDADAIFREEMASSRVKAQQYFAVLTNIRSVGVTDHSRTYDYILALRAVNTTDFMTGTYAKLPHAVLERTCQRIVSEVKGINRVVYDITGKPPATIEWE